MGENYNEENWVALYNAALIELEHARLNGLIKDARAAIVARVEKLQGIPGLHDEERRAIADALVSLRFLEQEEARANAEKQRHAVEKSLERLRSVAPAILKTQDEESQE